MRSRTIPLRPKTKFKLQFSSKERGNKEVEADRLHMGKEQNTLLDKKHTKHFSMFYF